MKSFFALLLIAYCLLLPHDGKFQTQTYTFTSALATSSTGPTQTQINTAYLSTNLNGAVVCTAGIQSWTVPLTGTYRIEATGASGGNTNATYNRFGGAGARMIGEFNLSAGGVIRVLVGQVGPNGCGTGGGGGGSFVQYNGTLIVAAGGGGGASSDNNGVAGTTLTSGTADFPATSLGGTGGGGGLTCTSGLHNGGGGGGYLTNGANSSGTPAGLGGQAFLNGGLGGGITNTSNASGGFGGGGGATNCTVGGGGGGGYSGGAGGQHLNQCVSNSSRSGGGGGGSYNSGINQVNTPSVNLGNGRVIITELCFVSLTALATNSISPMICPGAALTLTTNAISNYSWSTGANTSSIIVSPSVTTVYSVTGQSTASCVSTNSILVVVTPQPSVVVWASSPTVCAGSSITLTAIGSGGVPGFTYSWTAGPATDTYVVSQPVGIYSYTVIALDGFGCIVTNGTSLSFINNPILNVSNTTVCLGSAATLTVSGASTYTWNPSGFIGNTFTVIPTGTSNYSVTGTSTAGCTDNAVVTVSTLPVPVLSFLTASITCASLGSATVSASGGFGPYSYTWNPTAQTNSVALNLNPGTYTLTVFDPGTGCTSTATTVFTSLIPLSGNLSNSSSITCNGVGTGTAGFTSMAGGSPFQNYFWTNGASISSATTPTNLSAGNWSVTVTDALTACQIFSMFTITQPPAMTLNITPNTPTACVGSSIVLTGTNSGGTPGYSYTWTVGPPANTLSVAQATGGVYIYTLNSTDAFNCLTSNTISIGFVNNPVLTVSDVSICPLETGTLSVTGASSYTWNSSSVGSTFTASPVGSTQYAVVGSALSCTAAATASIIVKPIPSPTISSNSPICNGQTLLLSASGGTSYLWSGPLSFTSSAQNTGISAASPNTSGMYNLTLTAANSCTAPASTSVQVNPTPTISLSGGPVCLNSNLYLSANSFTGAGYFWSGPNSFTSSFQNPTLSAVSFSAGGTYSLLVSSANSCTNVSTLGVTVNPLPTVSISPTSTVICLGKSSTLTASGGNTYLWNTGSSATIIVLSPTLSSTYSVVGTSTLSCTNSAVRSISVNALPNVSVVVNPTVYCAGRSATLSASGANTYTWSASTTLSGTTIYSSSIIVNPAFTTFYNVKGTSATTGCSNTAFATVSVNPLPSLTVTATKTIICTGTSASITASGANTYTWLPGNLTGAIIATSPSVNTTYTVRGTFSASGCTNTAVRTISVNKTPTVTMVSNTPSICIGWSAVISPSGASTYTLLPGNLTGTSFTITPQSTTQYSLSGTNSVSCVNLIPSNVNIVVHNLKAIQGVVTSTTGQNNGMVVLYKYKTGLGKWDSLTNAVLMLSNYNFPAMATGSYVVKAVPFPTDLVETYGLNASSWKGANVINHGCLVNSTQNINVISFNNTIKSKATLSGKITQGAGYTQPGSPGSGIPNITVKAGIHPGPVIYQTTKTNALGQYTLANMAPNVTGQNYYILVDIPALDTNKTYHRIIITGFENFTSLDFVVDSQRIHPLNLKVGVKELSMLNTKIKVYPNPATEQISIELELNNSEVVSIELFDLSGRKVKSLISRTQEEKGLIMVLTKVEELNEGVYLLKIKIGNEEGVVKVGIVR